MCRRLHTVEEESEHKSQQLLQLRDKYQKASMGLQVYICIYLHLYIYTYTYIHTCISSRECRAHSPRNWTRLTTTSGKNLQRATASSPRSSPSRQPATQQQSSRQRTQRRPQRWSASYFSQVSLIVLHLFCIYTRSLLPLSQGSFDTLCTPQVCQ